DCSGVSDGSAAAILVRAEDAHRYTDKPLYVKALSFVAGPAAGPIDPDYDYTTFQEVVASAADAYAQAGIKDPRRELAMAEVHDCFTPTELVLMEDLGFAARGTGWKEVLAGTFDLEGELAVNPDGGLKSFGHTIAAGEGPEFFSAVKGADYFMGFARNPLGPEFYAAAPNMKLVQLISAGYNTVDLAAARKAGVPVANNGGANSVAVAEHAMMLI